LEIQHSRDGLAQIPAYRKTNSAFTIFHSPFTDFFRQSSAGRRTSKPRLSEEIDRFLEGRTTTENLIQTVAEQATVAKITSQIRVDRRTADQSLPIKLPPTKED
jgi:hypothetical protein